MDNKENDGISLSEIFSMIWKNIILVAIITVCITIVGGIYAFGIAKEKYKSTCIVAVAVESVSNPADVEYTNTLRVIQTVADLVEKDIVLKPVSEQTGISIKELRSIVSTSSSSTSYVFSISAVTTTPELSQKIANLAAKSIENVCETNSVISQFKAHAGIVDEAQLGVYSSPNKPMILLVSFIGGIVSSCIVVFVKEFMSNKFKTKEEIERMSNHIVIGVQYDDKTKGKDKVKSVSLVEPSIRTFEPYNKLLSNIKYSNLDNPYKVIMSTSTVMNELKSTTAANLAYCIANNGKKVLIMDLDTRKPVLHKTFNVSREKGLVEYIEGSLKKDDIIKKSEYNVDVITVGKHLLNPIAVIESSKLVDLISDLKKDYDYIIVDTPPLLACSDGVIISKLVDGVIYNVAMDSTKKKDVVEGISLLKNVDSKIIGINVTKAIVDKKDSNYYYYNSAYSDQIVKK